MFEEHNVNGLYISDSPVLNLYSNGRTTGTIIDSGHSMSQIESFYEGFKIPEANKTNIINGSDITNHLINLMGSDEIYAKDDPEWPTIVNQIKE